MLSADRRIISASRKVYHTPVRQVRLTRNKDPKTLTIVHTSYSAEITHHSLFYAKVLIMTSNSIYRKSKKITDGNFGSCDVYYMKPGTRETKHYHTGIEIVYVLKGSCQTHHQEGKVYVYQKGQVHEVINDSKDELVFVCLTIPPESKENTIYI